MMDKQAQDAMTATFDRYGAFWAFSNSQFEEKAKADVQYVRMSSLGGVICPKENAKALKGEIFAIFDDAVARDKAARSQEEIILYELRNHEAFYVMDIEDTVAALDGYGYTEDDVLAVYNKHYKTEVEAMA